MKAIKIFLIVAAVVSAAVYACALEGASTVAAPVEDAQYKVMGVSALIREAKADKARDKQERIAASLVKKTPANAVEITEMFEFLDTLTDLGKDDVIRGAVKGAIRKATDPSFAPFFAKQIKRNGVESRRMAIQKVADFKYKDAVPDLISMAKGLDDESSIRKMPRDEAYLMLNAFDALGDIGDERAVAFLLKKLGKMNGHENHVIGKLGLKVLPRLIEITKTSKDDREKESAYSAISSMKDKEAVPLLWETAKSKTDTYLQSVAIGSLLKITDENTTPKRKEVFEYLYSEADARKDLRSQTLGIAKDNKDVSYLVRVLNDKGADNRGNRKYAIICLGEIKAQSSVAALEETLKDSDKETRMRAAHALKQITGRDYSWELK